MRVIRPEEMHLVARHALVTHPDVGLDVLNDVADVERAVGVRQGGGDEQLSGSRASLQKPSIAGASAPPQRRLARPAQPMSLTPRTSPC